MAMSAKIDVQAGQTDMCSSMRGTMASAAATMAGPVVMPVSGAMLIVAAAVAGTMSIPVTS